MCFLWFLVRKSVFLFVFFIPGMPSEKERKGHTPRFKNHPPFCLKSTHSTGKKGFDFLIDCFDYRRRREWTVWPYSLEYGWASLVLPQSYPLQYITCQYCLFRANTSSEEIVHTFVPASLLFIIIFIVYSYSPHLAKLQVPFKILYIAGMWDFLFLADFLFWGFDFPLSFLHFLCTKG